MSQNPSMLHYDNRNQLASLPNDQQGGKHDVSFAVGNNPRSTHDQGDCFPAVADTAHPIDQQKFLMDCVVPAMDATRASWSPYASRVAVSTPTTAAVSSFSGDGPSRFPSVGCRGESGKPPSKFSLPSWTTLSGDCGPSFATAFGDGDCKPSSLFDETIKLSDWHSGEVGAAAADEYETNMLINSLGENSTQAEIDAGKLSLSPFGGRSVAVEAGGASTAASGKTPLSSAEISPPSRDEPPSRASRPSGSKTPPDKSVRVLQPSMSDEEFPRLGDTAPVDFADVPRVGDSRGVSGAVPHVTQPATQSELKFVEWHAEARDNERRHSAGVDTEGPIGSNQIQQVRPNLVAAEHDNHSAVPQQPTFLGAASSTRTTFASSTPPAVVASFPPFPFASMASSSASREVYTSAAAFSDSAPPSHVAAAIPSAGSRHDHSLVGGPFSAASTASGGASSFFPASSRPPANVVAAAVEQDPTRRPPSALPHSPQSSLPFHSSPATTQPSLLTRSSFGSPAGREPPAVSYSVPFPVPAPAGSVGTYHAPSPSSNSRLPYNTSHHLHRHSHTSSPQQSSLPSSAVVLPPPHHHVPWPPTSSPPPLSVPSSLPQLIRPTAAGGSTAWIPSVAAAVGVSFADNPRLVSKSRPVRSNASPYPTPPTHGSSATFLSTTDSTSGAVEDGHTEAPDAGTNNSMPPPSLITYQNATRGTSLQLTHSRPAALPKTQLASHYSSSGNADAEQLHSGTALLNRFPRSASECPATSTKQLSKAPYATWQRVAKTLMNLDDLTAANCGDTLFVFGSKGSAGPSQPRTSHFFAWDNASTSWTQIPIWSKDGRLPAPHSGYLSFSFDGCFYLIGSRDREHATSDFENLYRYDPKTNLWDNNVISVPADFIRGRETHTLTLVGKNLYIFAGIYQVLANNKMTWHFRDDLWVADLSELFDRRSGKEVSSGESSGFAKELCWRKIPQPASGDNLQSGENHPSRGPALSGPEAWPRRRAGHAACAWNGKLWIFGGSAIENEEGSALNDIWQFSSSKQKWSHRDTRGRKPVERYGHSCTVIDESRMLVFGGFCLRENRPLNDLHEYSFFENIWTCVVGQSDEAPPLPRFRHDTAVLNGSLWIFGGRTTFACFSGNGSAEAAAPNSTNRIKVFDVHRILLDKPFEWAVSHAMSSSAAAIKNTMKYQEMAPETTGVAIDWLLQRNEALEVKLNDGLRRDSQLNSTLSQYTDLVALLFKRIKAHEEMNKLLALRDVQREKRFEELRRLISEAFPAITDSAFAGKIASSSSSTSAARRFIHDTSFISSTHANGEGAGHHFTQNNNMAGDADEFDEFRALPKQHETQHHVAANMSDSAPSAVGAPHYSALFGDHGTTAPSPAYNSMVDVAAGALANNSRRSHGIDDDDHQHHLLRAAFDDNAH